jgi:hypothetical protein
VTVEVKVLTMRLVTAVLVGFSFLGLLPCGTKWTIGVR